VLGVPVALYLPRAELRASEKSGSSITEEVFLFCVRLPGTFGVYRKFELGDFSYNTFSLTERFGLFPVPSRIYVDILVLSVTVDLGSNFLSIGFSWKPPAEVLLKAFEPFAGVFTGLVGTLRRRYMLSLSGESPRKGLILFEKGSGAAKTVLGLASMLSPPRESCSSLTTSRVALLGDVRYDFFVGDTSLLGDFLALPLLEYPSYCSLSRLSSARLAALSALRSSSLYCSQYTFVSSRSLRFSSSFSNLSKRRSA
jgi:hypothetical protein